MAAKTKCIAAGLVILAAVMGCQTWPPKEAAPPKTEPVVAKFDPGEYETIPQNKGSVYWIDSETSDIRLFLWRGGPLAAKGHNHVMAVKNIEGAVFLPEDLLEDRMQIDMVFPVASIEVDPPPLRKKIGGAFASKISPEGVEGTRKNMLGEKVLNAEKFPTIGLHAEKVYGELPKMVIDTAVTLHGVRRRYLVPATVIRSENALSARGSFVIEQTDFGIEPFTALGGALYLQDPIMIEFEIAAGTDQPQKY